MTLAAFKENWTSPTMLSAPYGYIYIVMVFGSVLLFLTLMLQTIVHIAEPDSSEAENKRE